MRRKYIIEGQGERSNVNYMKRDVLRTAFETEVLFVEMRCCYVEMLLY